MSRKRCKRRVIVPVNPIKHAIQGARVTDAAELDQLRIRELDAIDDFAHGRATQHSLDTMCALVNLCEYMARNKIGPEALEACARAEAAIREIAERQQSTGKIGTTGAGLQAFRDVYAFHDLQRTSVGRSEYERAIERTFERVKNKAPGVVEV